MSGFDPDYGVYRADPRDPRTPEDNGREEWEAFNAFADFLDDGAIEEILNELLHGNPALAKTCLEKATEAAYRQWVKDQADQDAADIAADRAESRRAA